MVILLTLPEPAGNLNDFIEKNDRSYARRIGEATYADFIRRGIAPPAAYIFADRDRMLLPERKIAAALWDQLEPNNKLFNHPLRQLGRYDLLRALHQEGINDFNVYRIHELHDGIRFPVFIRVENDHNGPRTNLIQDIDNLYKEIARLVLNGFDIENLMVSEYQDTSGEDGRFIKYGCIRFGDRIVAQHALIAEGWNNKTDWMIRDDETREVNNDFFHANPHVDLVMPLFKRANIDYGRIDYSLMPDGRIQVWEINDNPVMAATSVVAWAGIPRHLTYMEGFDAMGEGIPPGPPTTFQLPLWEALA